jgi:hypothetical protein
VVLFFRRRITRVKTKSVAKAWVVSADMGYGHHRAVYPLKGIAEGEVITVGVNDATSPKERRLWRSTLGIYAFFSRARSIPVFGKPLFGILDELLRIPSYYPRRDLSKSTFQVRLLESYIKKGLCAGMLEKIRTKRLPVVTSFYAPAIAADLNGIKKVFCIICDADINRVWVARNPRKSRIQYCAPCATAAQRLKEYGVPEKHIFLTGFPLPLELLGGRDLRVLKADLGRRLRFLDPDNRFWQLHGVNVEHFLGARNCYQRSKRRLTILYSVGGAGAQREIGRRIALSLRTRIRKREVKLILSAGAREPVREFYEGVKREIRAGEGGLQVLFGKTTDAYFAAFNNALHNTDILWTKPSELSFYCGLGIPIVMAPAIGSQEVFNERWLWEIDAAVQELDPDYTDQWLFDLLHEGDLAEAAWSGFLKAHKLGTYNIMDIVAKGRMPRESSLVMR